jgi:hypothetical protein
MPHPQQERSPTSSPSRSAICCASKCTPFRVASRASEHSNSLSIRAFLAGRSVAAHDNNAPTALPGVCGHSCDQSNIPPPTAEFSHSRPGCVVSVRSASRPCPSPVHSAICRRTTFYRLGRRDCCSRGGTHHQSLPPGLHAAAHRISLLECLGSHGTQTQWKG